jgi:CRP-like cAMP-binding protein
MNPAQLFAHETNPVRLAPGEILFKAGDDDDCMYVLLEGALDVTVGDRVVENSTRGATVIAREVSSLAKLDEPRFRRIIQQNPFFATHLMKVLADRIRHMDQLLAQGKHS